MHQCYEKSFPVHRGCEENKSLWKTIRLYQVVNLEELLNLTKVRVPPKQNSKAFLRYSHTRTDVELDPLYLPQYSEQIEENFEDTNIVLSTITLLSPEEMARLQSVSNASKDVNFTQVAQQVCWDLRTVPGE